MLRGALNQNLVVAEEADPSTAIIHIVGVVSNRGPTVGKVVGGLPPLLPSEGGSRATTKPSSWGWEVGVSPLSLSAAFLRFPAFPRIGPMSVAPLPVPVLR